MSLATKQAIKPNTPTKKVGLGLRRELLAPLHQHHDDTIDFLEIAPENWMTLGGKNKKIFCDLIEKYPFYCHGLSLSIGGPAPLQTKFIKQIKKFLDEYKIKVYSEHLSFCSDAGHLYDLLPIPFTADAVRYVAKRVKKVEDILERPLILENASYYLTPPHAEMSESEFLNNVLTEANCQCLLDVNNVYVNSVNHNYNAVEFIKKIPKNRIAYFHIAGHYQQSKKLIIDTHGTHVVDPVWNLLKKTYDLIGVRPTVLERDFNIPVFKEVLKEVKKIKKIQSRSSYAS